MFGIYGVFSNLHPGHARDIAQGLSLPFVNQAQNRLNWLGDNEKFILAQCCKSFKEEKKAPNLHNSYKVNAMIFGEAYLQGINGTEPDRYLSNDDLIKLYIQKGTDCFSLLDGSWVAAIVDYRHRKILIARDRKGYKPIYYKTDNGIFCFSTSIKSFENCFSLSIDSDSAKMFLHFLYIPFPKTIYKEVYSVKPGECITFTHEKGLSKINYTEEIMGYPWLKEPENSTKDPAYFLSKFENLMVKAVSRQIKDSQKAAIFLSGGKDSSAIAVAAALSGFKNIECITVRFDEVDIDESKAAQEIAHCLGLKHRILSFSEKDYLDSLHDVISSLEQPMGDSAAFPVFLSIAKTSNDFDTYLEGSGSSSYFITPANGIEKFSWYLQRYMPWLSHIFKGDWKIGFSYRADLFINNLRKERPEQFIVWRGWTTKELNRLTGSLHNFDGLLLHKFYSKVNSPDYFKTFTYSICTVETYVRKVEKIGSYFGVNTRFPFFNNALTQFCQRLPRNLRYKGQKNKVLLRQFLHKYLPAELVDRPKGYFIFRKKTILRAKEFTVLDKFLSKNILLKYGLVDPEIAEDYINKYKNGESLLEDKVWSLFLLHCWLESRT